MADLTVDAADVAAVEIIEQDTAPAEAAFTAGAYVKPDATTGRFEVGTGASAATVGKAGGIALNSATYAGQAVTMLRKGIVYLGDALDGLSYDDNVFLSDTASGILATTAGTVSKVVGTVVAIFDDETTTKKALRLDL